MLEQRANTIEDLPNLSSLILDTGVDELSIAAAVVTADALSSNESCRRSFGSLTRKTRVSTICLASRLNEYCTVVNGEAPPKSRRMRTKSAIALSPPGAIVPATMRGFELGSSTDRPRSISKSALNEGRFGMDAIAAAICCCSSGEGVHTFSTFTLTGGVFPAGASCAIAHTPPSNNQPAIQNVWDTAAL